MEPSRGAAGGALDPGLDAGDDQLELQGEVIAEDEDNADDGDGKAGDHDAVFDGGVPERSVTRFRSAIAHARHQRWPLSRQFPVIRHSLSRVPERSGSPRERRCGCCRRWDNSNPG